MEVKTLSKFDPFLVLRGCLCLSILLGHSISLADVVAYKIPSIDTAHLPMFDKMLPSWLNLVIPITGQHYAFSFFVISGYLMGKSFYDRRYSWDKIGVIQFYKNRALRIVPLYYFVLTLCIIFNVKAYPQALRILGEYGFVSNWTKPTLINPSWSLSIEVQAYLVTPFLIFYLLSDRVRWMRFALPLLSLVLNIAIAISPTATNFFASGFLYVLSYYSYVLFPYFLGISINYLPKKSELVVFSNRKLLLIIAFIYCSAALMCSWMMRDINKYLGMIFFLVIVSGMIFLFANSKSSDKKTVCYMSALGQISYGIFLWHFPIALALDFKAKMLLSYFRNNGGTIPTSLEMFLFYLLNPTLVLFFSIVFSYITYQLIEKKYRPNILSGTGVVDTQKIAATRLLVGTS